MYESARDDSLRIMEDNAVAESDELVEEKVAVKLGIVGRVRKIIRRLRNEVTNNREITKVRERERRNYYSHFGRGENRFVK